MDFSNPSRDLQRLPFLRPCQFPVPQDLLFDDFFLFQEILFIQEPIFFCCHIFLLLPLFPGCSQPAVLKDFILLFYHFRQGKING